MAKQPTSYRLDKLHLDGIDQLGYTTRNETIEKIINGYITLRKVTLHSLIGVFTPKELTGMVAAQNGLLLTPEIQHAPKYLLYQLEDAEKFDNTISGNGADLSTLAEKIKQLNPAQVYFLQEEINRFWNAPGAYGSPLPNLENFLNTYTNTTEYRVLINDRVKYFDTYREALAYYMDKASEYFTEIEQPVAGAEMELQTKDKDNTIRLEVNV
jgi:hypothetical protein